MQKLLPDARPRRAGRLPGRLLVRRRRLGARALCVLGRLLLPCRYHSVEHGRTVLGRRAVPRRRVPRRQHVPRGRIADGHRVSRGVRLIAIPRFGSFC